MIIFHLVPPSVVVPVFAHRYQLCVFYLVSQKKFQLLSRGLTSSSCHFCSRADLGFGAPSSVMMFVLKSFSFTAALFVLAGFVRPVGHIKAWISYFVCRIF